MPQNRTEELQLQIEDLVKVRDRSSDPAVIKQNGVHIHVPAGSIPKDGRSDDGIGSCVADLKDNEKKKRQS